ncbi:MAG: metalloregulator ArsR/SmtB family transcription factor [Sneathiella sp.]
MVEYIDTRLDYIFSALGDPTRRAILVDLLEGESKLSDLEIPYPMSLTAVSKHVKVLAKAGLITHEKRGRERYCKLDPRAMERARTWLHHYHRYWERKLDQLDSYLTASKIEEALKKHRESKG